MPIINVQLLSGRTPAQKSNLIQELCQATTRVLGVPEDSVRIILTEVPLEHWGAGSRSMAQIRGTPPGDQKAD